MDRFNSRMMVQPWKTWRPVLGTDHPGDSLSIWLLRVDINLIVYKQLYINSQVSKRLDWSQNSKQIISGWYLNGRPPRSSHGCKLHWKLGRKTLSYDCPKTYEHFWAWLYFYWPKRKWKSYQNVYMLEMSISMDHWNTVSKP